MLFHLSIPARDPELVARAIAELWRGHAVPFPIYDGGWIAFALDDRNSAVEVVPYGLAFTPDGKTLNHNCVQVVGEREAGARPHTDSRALCRYAGVLYLTPDAPQDCGTSFYRQRMPSGQLGGNTVNKPHNTLVDALGTRFVPPDAFVEDVRVPNRFNRLLVYSAAMIHSATAYCGEVLADERMAAVFFWMGA